MARFEIDTDIGSFQYDTDPCSLTGPDGRMVDLSRFGYRYDPQPADDNTAPAFSPDAPLIGKEQPRVLKIQLGLGCNYSCSYCSQGGQKAEDTGSADAREFLANLDRWLHEAPEKVEFWGGEPMLYWHKIKILAPALRERFPAARMSLVTNGTLLTMERACWLHELGFTMAISHDGPGQSLRGADPFEDADWVEMVREVFALFGERVTFNAVITPHNFRLFELIRWFEQRMGEGVQVNVEGIVTDYGGAQWTAEQLNEMAAEVRSAVGSGLALAFPRLRWSVQQLLGSLAVERPLAGSHQMCGMDRQDQLAVDLKGAVLTCQNAGVESGHRIGSTADLAAVRLDTSTSWAARPDCAQCPVVHLCAGSCMFLQGEDFASSCRTSFHYNLAILVGAIRLLTGADVRSVSGWQPPTARKPFPIPVVASL